MDKCPYCGAETRPGDNFCLNCGNRLQPATPSASPQQAQAFNSDATLAAPEDWEAAASGGAYGTTPAGNWGSDAGLTQVAGQSDEQPLQRAESSSAPTAQATIDRDAMPARFILRSESGEILQEYPLDKPEVTIGRAPNSDILLSKDKLTSRRHATVHYNGDEYVLRDERSANGTFVNGQQLDDGASHLLHDGDHVGIGEHELIFRALGSPSSGVEDLPTVAVPYEAVASDMTYRTREDDMATMASVDDFSTRSMEEPEGDDVHEPAPEPVAAQPEEALSAANGASSSVPESAQPMYVAPAPAAPAPIASTPAPAAPVLTSYSDVPAAYAAPSSNNVSDSSVNFNRFSSLTQPTLPELSGLVAALSTMDGQIMSLQQQFNATQEAMRNHDAEMHQTTSQLRTAIRRVSERMDSTIADVARSREALAWAELIQLMEDVMNNPRDIEYVTKLARKARELNKVFQIHQNVLNTMAECNSLLRGIIGEEK
jgi:pSer/pThr/pTyr-binding forkhead associated (FHA) protein